METTDKVYLYGASGHAKVIMDLLAASSVEVPCLIDDNPSLSELDGVPVVHASEGLSPLIVSIGDCRIRRQIVGRLAGYAFVSAIHPSAVVSAQCWIEEGSVVMAGAILQAGVRIGRHCIVNSGASIDHDSFIGDFVHIAPHCTLCGGVEVGEGTWVGAGTTVIQGIRIGRNCYIGAGSVVVKDIPDNVVAYGNPARIIRKVTNAVDNEESAPVMGGGVG